MSHRVTDIVVDEYCVYVRAHHNPEGIRTYPQLSHAMAALSAAAQQRGIRAAIRLYHSVLIGNADDLPPTAGSNKFKGRLDKIRIWNSARSQAQLQANLRRNLAGSDAGLVEYWRLNETAGQSLTDSSVFANDGTLGADGNGATDDPIRAGALRQDLAVAPVRYS